MVAARPCPVARCILGASGAVDTGQFWGLIEHGRSRVANPADGDAVAAQAARILAARPAEDIVAAARIVYSLMVRSYLAPLWAVAYLVNGGCSDDGFDYFRGWLITQGQETFESGLEDPDALADVAAVRAAVSDQGWLDCEEGLYIADTAYQAATGEDLPDDVAREKYPALDPAWDFDFNNQAEMERRLPKMAALCQPGA